MIPPAAPTRGHYPTMCEPVRRSRQNRLLVTAVFAPVMFGLGSCAGSPTGSQEAVTSASVGTIPTSGMSVLPHTRPRDMIDFGDAVVFATVESERIFESPDQSPAGSGTAMLRYVTVHVSDVLWGAADLAGTSLQLQRLGGFNTDEGYVAQIESGGPILEVGGSYVVSLFQIDGTWSQQTGLTVYPVMGGAISMTGHALSETHPFDGMSVEDLRAYLAAIPADPAVEQHRDAEAPERLRLASGDGSSSDTATPRSVPGQ